MEKYEFVTDTSTLSIFDPAALRHRLGASADWWTIESDQLLEFDKGNAAFVDLGSDGVYEIEIKEDIDAVKNPISFNLKCPSGRLFLGAGEETTSEGLEPECIRGGGFITRKSGNCVVFLARVGANRLQIKIEDSVIGENDARSAVSI